MWSLHSSSFVFDFHLNLYVALAFWFVWFLLFSSFISSFYYYLFPVFRTQRLRFLTQRTYSSVSEMTNKSSSLSVESAGSGHRSNVTWTPPASVEGSTPTWTEGTPSFTESSSSGDLGKSHPPSIFFFFTLGPYELCWFLIGQTVGFAEGHFRGSFHSSSSRGSRSGRSSAAGTGVFPISICSPVLSDISTTPSM